MFVNAANPPLTKKHDCERPETVTKFEWDVMVKQLLKGCHMSAIPPVIGPETCSADACGAVMAVLRGIRKVRSDGSAYDETTKLGDAGFSSLDMVKAMLGVEAAFDLMIPQDMVTLENFRSAEAIATMIERLTSMQ